MAVLRKTLSGSAWLMSGQVLGHGFGFVRNVIVARLLGPDDFGIAAIFVITLSLLEMISDLAADKLIIQADDGDDPRLQNTAHSLLVLRGLLTGVIIFLCAGPIVWLFEVPDAKWAFQLLALVPITRGLLHLDIKRFQREMHFTPYVISEFSGQLAALVVALPLAYYIRDYSVALWLTFVQVGVMVLASHLLADRIYRWGWYTPCLGRFFDFGWPLLINGLLLFGIFQGDRVVIGANYDQAALGVYAVAFSLTMLPTLMMARVNGALVLPLFAKARNDRPLFEKRYHLANEILALAGGCLGVGFILAGSWFVTLVYGEAYAPAGAFIGILGAMQAVRVIRAAPSQAAMALGETRNTAIANAARSAAIIGMIIFAVLHAPLWTIASCGLVGELLAMAVAVALLRRQHQVPMRLTLMPFSLTLGAMVAAGIVFASFPDAPWYLLLAAAVALSLGMLLYAAIRFEVAGFALNAWQKNQYSQAMGGEL